MNIKIIETNKGNLSHCHISENERINTVSDFLSTIMSCSTSTIVLNKESITNDFYDLKTGIAGEFLQKVSNYNKRIIILGDFKSVKSKSLNDFIYESNINGSVIFSEDIEYAIKLLK